MAFLNDCRTEPEVRQVVVCPRGRLRAFEFSYFEVRLETRVRVLCTGILSNKVTTVRWFGWGKRCGFGGNGSGTSCNRSG